MKMKTKSQKGLTLIELSIAIATSAIVVLATGIIIVLGQTSWNETWKKVNLQRDASYAMLRMSQSIKAATSAAADVNGPVLNIDNGSITFSYVADTNDLQYQIQGQSPQTIIDGKMEGLQFNVQGNTVTIDLSLKEDDAQAHFVSTVMMRNSGG
jgi:Tfp pilus assembly protein PilW